MEFVAGLLHRLGTACAKVAGISWHLRGHTVHPLTDWGPACPPGEGGGERALQLPALDPQPSAAAGARTQTAESGPREREPLFLYPPQPPALRQAHFSDKVPSPSKVIFRCLSVKANTPPFSNASRDPGGAIPLAGCVPCPCLHATPPLPPLQPEVLPSPSLMSLPPRRKVVGSLLRLAGPPLLGFLDTLSFLICFLYF